MSELERWPRESARAHARLRHYCEQGPGRQLKVTAQTFGVTLATVSEQARTFEWRRRAAAWDEAQSLRVCPAPERLKEAAAAPITTTVPSDETRAAERAYLEAVETFRMAVESIGKAQMGAARGLTEKVRRSVAALLEDDRPLSAAQLPAFVSATTALAAAAQQQWSKSIGVDRLLQQMEQALIAVDAEVVDP